MEPIITKEFIKDLIQIVSNQRVQLVAKYMDDDVSYETYTKTGGHLREIEDKLLFLENQNKKGN